LLKRNDFIPGLREREEMDGSDGTREGTEDTICTKYEEEIRAIRALSFVTKLSPVRVHNGLREELDCEGLRTWTLEGFFCQWMMTLNSGIFFYIRDVNLLSLWLLVFHNTDTFYLPPHLALALSVIINSETVAWK